MSAAEKMLDAGGPAAPFSAKFVGPCLDPLAGGPVPEGVTRTHDFYGATMLDYFAAEALAGLLADSNGLRDLDVRELARSYAEARFIYAEAMLAERTKRGLV
jgi:hypothetical protein